MEREMCSYLEWKLNFHRTDLDEYEAEARPPRAFRMYEWCSLQCRLELAASGSVLSKFSVLTGFTPISTVSKCTRSDFLHQV